MARTVGLLVNGKAAQQKEPAKKQAKGGAKKAPAKAVEAGSGDAAAEKDEGEAPAKAVEEES